MSGTTLFMGKPIGYWVELEKQAEKMDVCRFIDEIASMRARVSFYEERIKDMDRFRKQVINKDA